MNWVFDCEKDFIIVANLDEVKEKFLQAQKNGSIMYQGVVSFDNQFLKKNDLLDAQNNLNETRLKKLIKMIDNISFNQVYLPFKPTNKLFKAKIFKNGT